MKIKLYNETVVCFLALVTMMVTKVDHGNHLSKDHGNHHGYYDGCYYDGNTFFSPRIYLLR